MYFSFKFKILLLFVTVIWASRTSVENGHMECDPDHCRLNCDYGFVSSGKKYFPADEDIEEKCVSIAAMLVGGSNMNALSSVEIFSSDVQLNQKQVQDFPYAVEYPAAMWVDGSVLVCGGLNLETEEFENRCWIYSACDNTWQESTEMTMRRGEAVGIVTDDDRPWVLGGKLAHNNATTTTEMWNKTGSEIFWTEGEPLDIVKMSHCGAANENGRKVIITGGVHSYNTVEEFDLGSGDHRSEADLNHKRHSHACSTYPWSLSVEAVIVAGGYNEINLPVDTVELWSPLEQIWREKKLLPDPRAGASMIVLDGKPTIIGGKSIAHVYDDALVYEVGDDSWTSRPERLKEGRSFAGAAAVPVTLFDAC